MFGDNNLRLVMLDDPGPFDTLETCEQFLAEVEAMPGFHGKAITIENVKLLIAHKKQELAASRHGVNGCTKAERSMRYGADHSARQVCDFRSDER